MGETMCKYRIEYKDGQYIVIDNNGLIQMRSLKKHNCRLWVIARLEQGA